MAQSNSGGSRGQTPIEAARDEFVSEKQGNYGSNLEYILEKWTDDWLQGRDEETLADVTPLTMRHYANYLERRARGDTGIAASTARTYYNYVSAFLSWAVEVEYLPENPAEKRKAKKQLPKATTNSGDQQFWSPDQRRTITDYVDERAREAIAADGTAATAANAR